MCQVQKLKTKAYGVFYYYGVEQPLHDLIAAAEHDKLVDWYLKPEQRKTLDGECYVGYTIGDNTKFLIARPIDPCPPCD